MVVMTPEEIIEDEMDEFGLSPWFDKTDFQPRDLVGNIIRALNDAGYQIIRIVEQEPPPFVIEED